MTIVDKLANEIFSRLPCCEADADDTAQAVWDLIKAEMLGDEVVSAAIIGDAKCDGCLFDSQKAALTAAMQKMEE